MSTASDSVIDAIAEVVTLLKMQDYTASQAATFCDKRVVHMHAPAVQYSSGAAPIEFARCPDTAHEGDVSDSDRPALRRQTQQDCML